MTLRYMGFNVPVVREFLEKHQHVVTVRGYDYHTEFAKVADLNVTIQRVKVCEIMQESDLNGFVTLSGFKTTRVWWKQIKIFCKGRMWLYRVSIIDDVVIDTQRQEPHLERDQPIDEMHPLDIRTSPELRDPALVDLQPFKDEARADRIRKQEEATARKQERMREMYGEQMHAAPTMGTHDPDKIMQVSNAEMALKGLCGA